jgi:hypothetical protein
MTLQATLDPSAARRETARPATITPPGRNSAAPAAPSASANPADRMIEDTWLSSESMDREPQQLVSVVAQSLEALVAPR